MNGFMIVKRVLLLFLLVSPLFGSNQIAKKEIPPQLEIPVVNAGDIITKHCAYTLLFDQKHGQARWVAYQLTIEETEKRFERSDKFKADPLIVNTDFEVDYNKSGFDRGHLAPAADMSWCEKALNESFYYSNMSPQVPSFNRGIWKKLETQVREWAIENSCIYVVTGPVLKEGLPGIKGPHHISVPEYYYKVLLDFTEPDIKGLGFLMANKGSKQDLSSYAVSIDSVETVTGIDFFPLLPDSIENLIENNKNYYRWFKSI